MSIDVSIIIFFQTMNTKHCQTVLIMEIVIAEILLIELIGLINQ